MADRTSDIRVAGSVLGTVSTLLDTVDWDQIANDISRADALGPIVMPTEYAAGGDTLSTNRRAIQATRTYLAALRRLTPEARR